MCKAFWVPAIEKKSSKKFIRSTQRGGSWIKNNLDVRTKGPWSIVTRFENSISCVNPIT